MRLNNFKVNKTSTNRLITCPICCSLHWTGLTSGTDVNVSAHYAKLDDALFAFFSDSGRPIVPSSELNFGQKQ